MTTAAKPHHRFEALDGLRGVAALSVLLYHGGYWADAPWLFSHGYLAVDLFFCLSGFVLASAYDARLKGGMTFLRFAKLRIVRLWPMLILALAIGALYELAKMAMGNSADVMTLGGLMQAVGFGLFLIPMLNGQRLFPLNEPSWSLLFEMGANLIWGLCGRWMRTEILLAVLIGSGALFGYFVIDQGTADIGPSGATFWMGWARVGFSFTLGLLLYRLFLTGRLSFGAPIALLAVALAAVLFFPHVAANASLDLLAVFVVMPAIVFAGARSSVGDGAIAKVWRFSGDVSYPLYVLHHPLWLLTNRLLEKAGIQPNLITILAYGTGVMAVAWLALRFYDEPIRKRLSPRFRPSTNPQTRSC